MPKPKIRTATQNIWNLKKSCEYLERALTKIADSKLDDNAAQYILEQSHKRIIDEKNLLLQMIERLDLYIR